MCSYSDNPDGYLSEVLAACAQRYTREFRDYWGLDATEPPEGVRESTWRSVQATDHLARVFLRSAKALHIPPAADGNGFADLRILLTEPGAIFRPFFGLDFVRQRIELEFATEFEDSLIQMTDRALELLTVLVSVRSEIARQYLYRVADCYIRGMTVEAMVMCGAALEAALALYATDADLIAAKLVRPNRQGEYNIMLGTRIHFLKGRLSVAAIDKAYAISRARNDAVHVAPNLVDQVRDFVKLKELLVDLGYVLDALDALDSGANP